MCQIFRKKTQNAANISLDVGGKLLSNIGEKVYSLWEMGPYYYPKSDTGTVLQLTVNQLDFRIVILRFEASFIANVTF